MIRLTLNCFLLVLSLVLAVGEKDCVEEKICKTLILDLEKTVSCETDIWNQFCSDEAPEKIYRQRLEKHLDGQLLRKLEFIRRFAEHSAFVLTVRESDRQVLTFYDSCMLRNQRHDANIRAFSRLFEDIWDEMDSKSIISERQALTALLRQSLFYGLDTPFFRVSVTPSRQNTKMKQYLIEGIVETDEKYKDLPETDSIVALTAIVTELFAKLKEQSGVCCWDETDIREIVQDYHDVKRKLYGNKREGDNFRGNFVEFEKLFGEFREIREAISQFAEINEDHHLQVNHVQILKVIMLVLNYDKQRTTFRNFMIVWFILEYGDMIGGSLEVQIRAYKSLNLTSEMTDEDFCLEQTKKYFPKSVMALMSWRDTTNAKIAKESAEYMIALIQAVFGKMLLNNEQANITFSKNYNQEILSKLLGMVVHLDYPEYLIDDANIEHYTQLTMSLIRNVFRIRESVAQTKLSFISYPYNRRAENWEWVNVKQLMLPFYDVTLNELTLPAGFLRSAIYTNESFFWLGLPLSGLEIAREMLKMFSLPGHYYNGVGVSRVPDHKQTYLENSGCYNELAKMQFGESFNENQMQEAGNLKTAWEIMILASRHIEKMVGSLPSSTHHLKMMYRAAIHYNCKKFASSDTKMELNTPFTVLPEIQAAFNCDKSSCNIWKKHE